MILTTFESVQRAYTRPEYIIEESWLTIAELLQQFHQVESKEQVPLFNLWQFNRNGEPGRKRIYENFEPTENYEIIPNTIRRCKANAEGVWGLVLDYDGKSSIDETFSDLSGFEYVLYTTFRHTPQQNKFRVILPFRQAVAPEVFKRKKSSLSKTFPAVDHASFSESQSFYFHSGNNPDIAISYWASGEFLDLDCFEDEIVEEPVYRSTSEFTGDRDYYRDRLIESLATCSGLHYANDVSHLGVLTLVALCKSAGITFDEYDLLCHNMASSDSSLQSAQLRKMAWISWNPHSGITAKTREAFISAYGGVSQFNQQAKQESRTPEEIRAYVRAKYKKENSNG